MVRDTHEDDELSFVTIAAATANALRYLKLDKEEKNPGNNKPNPEEATEQAVVQQRAFVERRLRELADWERRIREDRLRYKNWKRP
jgi:mannitol-1-phosphate/altronate dehydrogenase